MPTIRQAVEQAVKRIDRFEAKLLLAHCLGVGRTYLITHDRDELETSVWQRYQDCVRQRAENVPVPYICGQQEFFGRPFKVTPDVLIPRPDTEILVENVLANADNQGAVKIADIGTGSGAIILSLLANLPKAQGKTVDIAAKAVEVAKENAQSLQVADRCEFFVGDLFAPFAESGDKFDIIVSNPPYIPQADIATLEADVRAYEPVSALTDGGDGLSYYRRLLSEGKRYIKENGFIALEIGIYQAQAVKQIALDNGWQNIKIVKDYAGIDRVVLSWNVN